MQAILMNFGDQTRVVNDTHNVPVAIGIGKIVECDMHEVHFNMVRRAIGRDTLMVVPKDARMPPRLEMIMDAMRSIEDESYDTLLQKVFKVAPPRPSEENGLRPTREMIRTVLKDQARDEVAKVLQLQSQVRIREEQTKDTPPQQPVPTTEPKPPASQVDTPQGKRDLRADAEEGDMYYDEVNHKLFKLINGDWVEGVVTFAVVAPPKVEKPKRAAKERSRLAPEPVVKSRAKRERL